MKLRAFLLRHRYYDSIPVNFFIFTLQFQISCIANYYSCLYVQRL